MKEDALLGEDSMAGFDHRVFGCSTGFSALRTASPIWTPGTWAWAETVISSPSLHVEQEWVSRAGGTPAPGLCPP